MKIKRILLFLLVLMFIPTTTFALTKNKGFEVNKKSMVKGGDTCDQYIKYYYQEPVVGEEPAKTVKAVFKTSEREKEVNITVEWFEYDVNIYDTYMAGQNKPEGNKLTGAFKKDKVYYWDYAEEVSDEEDEELNALFGEFTCEPVEYLNDVLLHDDELSLMSVLTQYITPVEKNNTLEITDASFVYSDETLENHYTSPEEFVHGVIDKLSVKFNLKFSEVNKKYVYLVTIKNGSNEDVEIQVGDLAKKSDYIDYKFEFLDGNNIAKAYSNKFLQVTATYKTEVPDELLDNGYTESNEIELKVGTDALPDEKENNPKTGVSTAIVVIGVVAAVVIAVVRFGIKKKIKYLVIVLASMIVVVPFAVNAIKSVTLKVITNVEINPVVEKKVLESGETINYREHMTYTEWLNSSFNTEHYLECVPCDEVTEAMVGKEALCPVLRAEIKGSTNDFLMEDTAFEVVTLDQCHFVE